jgi:hypothetical protein
LLRCSAASATRRLALLILLTSSLLMRPIGTGEGLVADMDADADADPDPTLSGSAGDTVVVATIDGDTPSGCGSGDAVLGRDGVRLGLCSGGDDANARAAAGTGRFARNRSPNVGGSFAAGP